MKVLILNLIVFGAVFFGGFLTGCIHRSKVDRKIECTAYIQGKYLEGNCWKDDTITVQLYIK